ncbi:hypothetical protein [Spiroplasma sp. SV19]|uniref:hypothetical protein n=1 Tax=Spiroplasma sp. SV19 TaxID=2570468 RepID=UPI0024B6F984|nr:hypothetical protein [Spiroplasma sp. SV19]WHQ37498.1 hypothetical protein E7Y35_06610 [Spiroplasma sp. SV19]
MWKKNENGVYVQTSNIGDFDNKIKNKVYYNTLPSRAKLNFKNNVLYISKLNGERKFIYREHYNEDFIISNGMCGITANENRKYTLYAFLLSDFFYKIKSIQSIGTTMRGINDNILNSIVNKYYFNSNLNFYLKKLFNILSKTSIIIEKLSFF